MKKVLLLIAACLGATMMSAQLKVGSTGFATSSNIMMDGVMGVPDAYPLGVFTVTSNRVDPMHDYVYNPGPLMLICTQSSRTSYPFANYYGSRLNFYVTQNGAVYTNYGLVTTSDSLRKENITDLRPTLSKIKSLHTVSFNYKNEESNIPAMASLNNETVKEDLPLGATPEISRQINEEKSRKRIGLIAQEVEQIFPEVVRTSYDGTKGILYNDLVGVLIEGMKELQDSLSTQVHELTSRVAFLNEQLAALTAPAPQNAPRQGNQSTTGKLGQKQAELYQNTPNPFNQETEIAYRLSSEASSASICIYNLSGQQLKKYPLAIDSSTGKITLSASEYAPGMYIYALVINNQVIDSKRMTLTD